MWTLQIYYESENFIEVDPRLLFKISDNKPGLIPNAISWQLLGLEDPLGAKGYNAGWNVSQPDVVPG